MGGAVPRQVTGSATTLADPDELLRRATMHLDRSEAAAARDLAQQVAAGDDPRLPARALAVLVRCHLTLATYAEGLVLAREAVEVCRQVDDQVSEARVRVAVALMLVHAGYPTEAVAEIGTALDLAGASGDLNAEMTAIAGAGTVYQYLEQSDRCVEACAQAAEIARLLGHEATNSGMLITMGCAYMTMAEHARAAGDEPEVLALSATAQALSREGIAIARQMGNRQYEVAGLGNLAESLSFCGRAGEALALLEACQPDPARDSPRMIAHILDARGAAYLGAGRYEEAIRCLREALAATDGKASEMVIAEHLAEACERSGDLRGALDYHRMFHAAFKQVASEKAQRVASVAAVRMETARAKAAVEEERARTVALQHHNRELLRESREDPLTGLANRRHMDELLADGVSGRAFLVIDIDHFKQVNDQHSHLVGDQVLRHVARLLHQGCRTGDAVVRLGGEEFAVLLATGEPPEAMATAQRLRAQIAAYDWAAVAPGLAVTASIGVAAGGEADGPTTMLALADERLYAAKRAGRNRVHGPPDPDGRLP